MERYGAWANNHVAQMKPEVKGDWVRYADAQATVEALQRERDEYERKCRDLCQAHGVLLIEHHDAKKALDAECLGMVDE